MINQRLGRLSAPRTAQLNPAWWLVPLGVAGCLLIGLVMGVMQSPMLAAVMLGAGAAVVWVALVVARPEWALVIYTVLAVNLNSIDLPAPGGVRVEGRGGGVVRHGRMLRRRTRADKQKFSRSGHRYFR